MAVSGTRRCYAKDGAAQIPQAGYGTVRDAIHFSFLAECKLRGPEILENEGELDPLCEDGGQRSRSDIHNELSCMIIDGLRGKL